LAICVDNKPYSLPINFVKVNEEIYFHGAKKGKKIDILKENSFASFSVVQSFSVLPSYFSTNDNKAYPATHLFRSVIMEGEIVIVTNYEEKAKALESLMKKLQKEGKYIPLKDKIYEKAINATGVFKLMPTSISAKSKVGENFNQNRYQRVKHHLEQRGTSKDKKSLNIMQEYYNKR
ncbi:MAG: pyridoxamine 5'-phosphate oxidase family protein, partial [Arcobacter sp.]|nr:pyridoxamine 5'-phosphate oxidase family protein [Arcobacter sp.]